MDRADVAVEQWGANGPLPPYSMALFGRLLDALTRVDARSHEPACSPKQAAAWRIRRAGDSQAFGEPYMLSPTRLYEAR